MVEHPFVAEISLGVGSLAKAIVLARVKRFDHVFYVSLGIFIKLVDYSLVQVANKLTLALLADHFDVALLCFNGSDALTLVDALVSLLDVTEQIHAHILRVNAGLS